MDFPKPSLSVRLNRHDIVLVLISAALSFGLYLLLMRVVPGLTLAEPSFSGEIFGRHAILTRPLLSAIQETGSLAASSAWFIGICGALFAVYFWMLRRAAGITSVRVQTLIFSAGALFLIMQTLAPVLLSTDVFAYAIYGRVLSIHHANPYTASPPIAAGDPFMQLFGQQYIPSWYGPLWTLISAGITCVGGEHVGLMVLLFRGCAILSALLCAIFIWLILRAKFPERTAQGLVFFLWNPLLVVETGLSGHNDCTMLALVLLGFWLHTQNAKALAVIALTLSSLVKFLTGMLIPLYIVLVLRETRNLRGRISFLVRGGLVSMAIAASAMIFARSGSDVPAGQAALAPDFYRNNFHELIFKGVRLALGEDSSSVETSIYFQGWWLTSDKSAPLLTSADVGSIIAARIEPGVKLIVVAPQENKWARVYEPEAKQFGFIDTTTFTETTRPAPSTTDPVVQKYESMAMDWPTVQIANFWIRVATWLWLALFGLWCAWRTDSFLEYILCSSAALIAAYYTIVTEIWPWYVNWVVALGALAPHRGPARLVLFLSPLVMTLYVTLGYMGSEHQWISAYRSLPAFVLPVILFVITRRIRSTPGGIPAGL